MVVAAIVLAFLLDFYFAEPRRYHPLVGFGVWANYIELRINKQSSYKWFGVLAWCLVVVPLVLFFYCIDRLLATHQWLSFIFSALLLYLSIGWQSLLQHARAVATPLRFGDINNARKAVAMIVSRDTAQLDKTEVAKAATESVLENGADAVFCALFWFLLAGVPGVVLYRLSNTLDAMWGYKKPDLLHFGWCAARMDDVLNFIPAHLVVLTYALFGRGKRALHCAWYQGRGWKSPNAGPVMAAGAGALQVSLGGTAIYFGEAQQRPNLGEGPDPKAGDLDRAVELVDKGVYLWALLILVLI